jgi:hypothetical protein
MENLEAFFFTECKNKHGFIQPFSRLASHHNIKPNAYNKSENEIILSYTYLIARHMIL